VRPRKIHHGRDVKSGASDITCDASKKEIAESPLRLARRVDAGGRSALKPGDAAGELGFALFRPTRAVVGGDPRDPRTPRSEF
jgi:hypothetical protein